MADQDQVRYAYPKYKVYIFGVEVTDDTVSITVNNHDSGSPNTCQITLLNENDKYIITTDNMAAMNNIPGGRINIPWLNKRASDQSAKATDVSNSISLKDVRSERKAAILRAKNNVVQAVSQSDREGPTGTLISETNLTNYYGTSVRRYPIADGAPVFNSMDPVRIAMRDPFDPSRWYWHFSGFVSDMVDNTNENNVKTLTILVEDPTKLFRYTRVFLNPGIIDAKLAIAKEDLRVQSFFSNFLRGLSLPEIFFTLFFGPDKVGTDEILQKNVSAAGKSNLATKLRGIGHFALDSSSYYTFGSPSDTVSPGREGVSRSLVDVKPPTQLDSLQTWQSIIDHEVQPSDLFTMATEEDRNTQSSIISRGQSILSTGGKLDVEGVIDYIGTHPQEYLVDGGKLIMLLPNSLGSDNSSIIINDIIQSYPLNSEWHSAGQVMKEVIDRIQFAMYSTPRGDIVIEPPLYDFDPDDFGMNKISGDSFVDTLPPSTFSTPNASSILSRGEQLFRGRDRGPYGGGYVIQKKDTYSWESAFVDEKVYTMAICPHAIVQNWESIPNTSIIGDMAVVRLPDLIPLYGVRPVPITPRGFIASKEAAQLYANVTLNLLNTDSHTTNINHVPNIQLWLNRPIYVEGRNFIGTTKQITHSITWGSGGEMATISDLYAVRTWSGQVSVSDPTQPIYTTLGGQGSRPLDYAILWKKAEVPKPSTGSSQDTSLSIGTQTTVGGKAASAINTARSKVKKT